MTNPIEKYKDIHIGERLFLVCNGPSLNDVVWSTFANTKTFGSNRVYLTGYVPDYYCCVNPLVLEQYWEEISDLNCIKFLPKEHEDKVGVNRMGEIIWIDTTFPLPHFSSPEGAMYQGHTVTFVMLQIAYYMGFEEVIIVGMDHWFGNKAMRANLEAVATGPDENHFNPTYFTDGVRWNYPDLGMSEISYSLAKGFYERNDRRIVNCSAFTKCRTFDILPLRHALDKKGTKLSAIVSAYNAEEYIDGLLEDLVSQTLIPEIVVVCEQGSYEHEAVLEYRRLFPVLDITIITTPDIPTIYSAWNMAIRQAKGRYLTNANCDDRHHPHAYEIMVNVLDARPDLDLVYHNSYISWVKNQTFAEFDASVEKFSDLAPGRYENKPGYFSWLEPEPGSLLKGCHVGPQPMWRANIHQRFGYFRDDFKVAGDYDMWLRIKNDHNFAKIDRFLGVYHASLDGVELSHPIENESESRLIFYMNQQPEADLHPSGENIRISIGDKYVMVRAVDLFNQMEELKEQAEIVEDGIIED